MESGRTAKKYSNARRDLSGISGTQIPAPVWMESLASSPSSFLAYIQNFPCGAARLGRIKLKPAFELDNLGNQFSEFTNRCIFTAADIKKRGAGR